MNIEKLMAEYSKVMKNIKKIFDDYSFQQGEIFSIDSILHREGDIWRKNGIYVYTWNFGEVLCIGKSGAQNFRGRAYKHFKKPAPKYGAEWKKYLNKSFDDPNDIFLHPFLITPKLYLDFTEVLLQTIYVKLDGNLPPLNYQIG